MAIKKDGAEMPAILLNTAVLSIQVFLFIAAVTPSKIPSTQANNMAVSASTIVPGNASANTVERRFFCLVTFTQVRHFNPYLSFCSPKKNTLEVFLAISFFV